MTIQKGDREGTFLEQNCTIEHAGVTFESGGSYLGIDPKTGRYGGVLYMYKIGTERDYYMEGEYKVGTWESGGTRVPCRIGNVWRNNFGDKRCMVYCTWEGRKYTGIWCCDAQDCINVREVRA